MADDKPTGDGGAKERGTSLDKEENPALQKENRQAVKNQSTVSPEQYPERGETVAPKD